VDPPDDAIEITQGTIWLQDGILIERTKDVHSTIEMVAETFDVFRDLGGGSRRPFLFDVRNWQGGELKAWNLAIEQTLSTLSAVAVLVDPDSASVAGPFPEAVNRMLIPVRFFTNEEEALAFLRGFLPRPGEQGAPPRTRKPPK